MGELNEACVLDNLKQRYQSNLIYVNNRNEKNYNFEILCLELFRFVLGRSQSV